ncbi:GNAT family N-acetyltransferase [Paenibacillus sp. IB182496]|uniref:GNAT family N-acetyltransferase n=1 Tax=Paenibacillus sabuli TaxID=2772509 RepID=A0A927GPR7_9BACL|nr:GNAT family N-acetyltransferase [Paenibacillus sabuli]MBD2843603.1 GNAT family N-acetyltransferase [Paenibacillus sabuli]
MFILRAVVPQDEPFLFQLYAGTRIQEIAQWGWDRRTALGFLRMQWTAQQRSYAAHYPELEQRIVQVEERPVGRLLLSRARAADIVVDLSLLPELRGQGIGTALLQEVLRQAAVAKKPCRLQVTAGNPARRLYERLGFRTTGADEIYEQMEWRS